MDSKVIFKRVTYEYPSKASEASLALSNVSFQIAPGSLTAVVGRTGSGKSTLIQQINGLLKPTRGVVRVGSITVKPQMSIHQVEDLRRRVGLVFQVPQDQLFGETVRDDLAFGPRNLGFDKDQINSLVRSIAHELNLSKGLLMQSPFDLSGGQMKRVAIAGVLACRPKILVLDEPTVGLDEWGQIRMMKLLIRLKKRFHLTIILVTHQMSLVAKYATQVLVLDRGRLIADVSPNELFKRRDLLRRAGLLRPFAPRFAIELIRRGIKLPKIPRDVEELSREIIKVYQTRRYRG